METTYIIVSYLIVLGMMIESNDKFDDLTTKECIVFLLSPIMLPIFIGMSLAKK